MPVTKLLATLGLGFAFLLPAMGQGAVPAAKTSTAKTSPRETATELNRLLVKELPTAKNEAAPIVGDETFVRRVWLDLVGEIPPPAETIAFELDPAPDKRARLIERLLADEAYGRNWARYWRDVILSRRTEERALLVTDALVNHLTTAFNQNTPWNEIAREFITATGDVRETGQTAIIVAQDGQTEDTAAEMSRIFLGIQIQCAQCHDHVSDRWKRTEFHQLAAFFPRVAVRPQLGEKRTLLVVGDNSPSRQVRKMNGRRGVPEHYMPDLKDPSADGTKMQPVFFLTGAKLSLGTRDEERRAAAAKFITEDPWFARAVVNRMWSELCGEGFYEPVDDIGPDRTPLAPETLDLLTAQFIASGYDLKWLLRTITATELYECVSRPRRQPEEGALAANCPQRLRADQLFNSLTRVLEVEQEETSSGIGQGPGYRGPVSKRTQFAAVFGYDPSQPREEISGTIPQALALMNAPTVNLLISARTKTTMLGRLAAEEKDDRRAIEALYLRCLARQPSDTEQNTCLNYMRSIPDRGEALEDILWALLNSTEFLQRK